MGDAPVPPFQKDQIKLPHGRDSAQSRSTKDAPNPNREKRLDFQTKPSDQSRPTSKDAPNPNREKRLDSQTKPSDQSRSTSKDAPNPNREKRLDSQTKPSDQSPDARDPIRIAAQDKAASPNQPVSLKVELGKLLLGQDGKPDLSKVHAVSEQLQLVLGGPFPVERKTERDVIRKALGDAGVHPSSESIEAIQNGLKLELAKHRNSASLADHASFREPNPDATSVSPQDRLQYMLDGANAIRFAGPYGVIGMTVSYLSNGGDPSYLADAANMTAPADGVLLSLLSAKAMDPPSPTTDLKTQAAEVGSANNLPSLETARTPEELRPFLESIRGFNSSPPGRLEFDPNLVGSPIGKGYETAAVIQLTSAKGDGVLAGMGIYLGRADVHGEIQALDALVGGLPPGANLKGGTLTLLVEKEPCPSCEAALRQRARDLGVGLDVYTPTRESMTRPGLNVSAKTASSTSMMGSREGGPTRPPTTVRQVFYQPAP